MSNGSDTSKEIADCAVLAVLQLKTFGGQHVVNKVAYLTVVFYYEYFFGV